METKIHKDQIEAAVAEYGARPRANLPDWLRLPLTESQFALAVAVYFARKNPDGPYPVYDDDGFLTAWRGISLSRFPFANEG